MPTEGFGAVVERPNAAIHVEPIVIDDPGPGEVLVRIAASGVCHSDVWAIEHGNWGAPWPMLLGHEGAGVVEAVGAGVATVQPGNRVVMTWAVPCGRCRHCLRGAPRRCAHELHQPPRMRRSNGDVLTGVLHCGTLSTHSVVTEPQVVPMPDELSLIRACLLGCGVSTGVGAALHTAKVWRGSTVAVIGLGGIGLAALQGSRIAGAERLIAIDVVPRKLEWALRLGATDVVDAAADDPVEAVRSLTHGDGVDVAFEAVGSPACVRQAVEMRSRRRRSSSSQRGGLNEEGQNPHGPGFGPVGVLPRPSRRRCDSANRWLGNSGRPQPRSGSTRRRALRSSPPSRRSPLHGSP